MIWFTADLHFAHSKPFIYEPRGFSDVTEMNETIIERFNSLILPNEDLYILGDVMLKDDEVGIDCLRRLHGRKHIIIGNHDTRARAEKFQPYAEEIQNAAYFKHNGYKFFLCHFPTITSNNDYEEPLKARVLNLCGHTHTKDPFSDWDKGYIYHVEVDAHDCYPMEISSIISSIKQKVEDV